MLTPTLAAALQDNDSAEAPAANVTFSPAGTRTLMYSSDVSAPQGDAEDWIQFTPYGANILIGLTCTGNGTPKVQIAGNGSALQNWDGISCGKTKLLSVTPGRAYLAEVSILPGSDLLTYVHYTLRVESTG